jgi:hypothetical protein
MKIAKIYGLALLTFVLLPPLFGVGLTTSPSNHLLLATWFLLGFDCFVVLGVILGFYGLYCYQSNPENQVRKNSFNKQQPALHPLGSTESPI